MYSYNLREIGKRKILFTSETNVVVIIDHCRQCIVIFKVGNEWSNIDYRGKKDI